MTIMQQIIATFKALNSRLVDKTLVYRWYEELYGERLLAGPHGKFHHEAFNTLEH